MSRVSNKKKAENLYKKYLNKIQRKYGDKETNSKQLFKIGKELFKKKFIGVFASDQIPLMRIGDCAIVNLDNSSLTGSHWVAVVKENKKTYIYDSFGRKTIKILPNLIQSGNGIIFETENDKEQSDLQENCGQRSISWLCVYKEYGWNFAKWI